MKTFLSRFSQKQSGVTLDEYALIAALILCRDYDWRSSP